MRLVTRCTGKPHLKLTKDKDMEGFHLKTFEVKTSKAGLSIPVVNDVHLHSAYDPMKEATTLIEKHHEAIKKNNKIIVFGLGYGYHIEVLLSEIKKYHKNFEIYVIEPVYELFEGCRRLKRITDERVSIYAGHKIEVLYSDVNLVNYLSQKPTIIGHPASMNLHADYFKKFMSYEAPDYLVNVSNQLESNEIKRCFEKNKPGTKYEDFIIELKNRKGKFHKSDYLILAVEEIAR